MSPAFQARVVPVVSRQRQAGALRRTLCALCLLCLVSAPAVAQGTGVAPRAYVTNFASDTVSVIDTGSDTVVATLPVGDQPLGVAVNDALGRVYVTNFASGSVSVIDGASHALLATIPVGRGPQGIAVNRAGTRVWVANSDDATVSVIDTATDAVEQTVVLAGSAQPLGVAVRDDGSKVYVSRAVQASLVAVLDGASGTVLGEIPTGNNPKGLALAPHVPRLYVAAAGAPQPPNVTVIDTDADSVVPPGLAAGLGPQTAVAHPSGNPLYVTSVRGGVLSVIDLTDGTLRASVPIGRGGLFGVDVTPDGEKLYVADNDQDSSEVYVLDTASNTVIGSIVVGSRPVAFGRFISAGASVSELEMLAALQRSVAGLGLPQGAERSLQAKLSAATLVLSDVTADNDHAAAGPLRAFGQQVRAQSGKMIEAARADELMERAREIVERLPPHGRRR